MIRSVTFLLLAWCSVSLAQEAPDPLLKYRAKAIEKWEAEIKKLEALDNQQEKAESPILFIGSSSIRMWKDLAADMQPWRVLNRGFGGAKFTDLAVFVDRLVSPHHCKAIVIFVANDIVGKPEDRTPEEVAELFKYIVGRIRKTHPDQPVFLIAVTPTPSRFQAWPQIQLANAQLEEVCRHEANLHFIATEKQYLDDQGQPIEKYFIDDKLHQNREGYVLWGSIIKRKLEEVLK
jgi:lysophospholipase L1-like esterase